MRTYDGDDWYKTFIEKCLVPENIHKFKTIKTNTKWTKFILKIIEKWGHENSYNVEKAPNNPIGIDLKWKDSKDKVYIVLEHENSGNILDRLRPEIERLVNDSSADLRILITYVSNKNFEEKSKKLRDHILSKVKKNRDFNFEFLLLVGPWGISHPSEFVCFNLFPSYRHKIVLPRYHRNLA